MIKISRWESGEFPGRVYFEELGYKTPLNDVEKVNLAYFFL